MVNTILSFLTSLATALRDYVSLGVSYYLGRAHVENKAQEKIIEDKDEYLKKIEDVARMSNDDVFNELRSKYTPKKK